VSEANTKKDLSQYLRSAEATVEAVYNEVVKTQGYTEEVEKLRILVELLKEQSIYENPGT
jgi:hypothetical protein